MARNYGERSAWAALLMICLLFTVPVLQAQQITGTLTGTVADTSGAVIPNAKVTMKNEGSGDLRQTTTNTDGYFTIAAVPAGAYSVTVEAAGFGTWKQTGIVFNAGDKRNLSDIALQVGNTSEQVQVIAATDVITPVDSGEKSSVLTTYQLQNIPVVGRSAAELLRILPGMAPTGTGVQNRAGFTGEVIGINGNGDGGKQSALGNYSANGTRPEAMDIVMDGSHASDPGCNCATPVNPNVDMLQEFKVLQSNFSAENAKGPVVISTISKAGSSQYHGMGYFTARHYSLIANEWDLNRNGQPKPQNQFYAPGGNIGGPILFPGTGINKNRDKLFFFAGYEYFKQDVDVGVLRSTVPTAAMRNGDFSDPAIANLTGEYNKVIGVIPQSQIDPGGKVLMNLLPLPNADPKLNNGNNYVASGIFPQNQWQALGRVDYGISDNTKLFVRYNAQRETQNFPIQLWWRNGGAVPYPTPVVGKNASDSISSSLTHVFNPTLTNELVFGLTRVDFPNSFEDPKKVSRSALGYPYKGVFKNALDQIPSFQDTAGSSLFNPGGFDPVLFATKYLPSVTENVSKVWGTHTAKFGFFWEMITNNQPNNGNSNGAITYGTGSTNSTGNAYADLLQGIIGSYNESTKNVLHNIAFQTYEFYGQDSWKLNRRLTLEYGLRFAHLGNWYDREGVGAAIFDESKYSNNPADVSKLTGLRWNKIDSSIPLSGSPTRGLFYSPRFGVAYDIFGSGRTTFRGGWGMFRYHDPQGSFPSAVDAGAGQRFFNSPGGALTLAGIENLQPGQVGRTSPTIINGKDDQQPLTYSYSATISQRLGFGTLWEIGYVGNQSKYQLNSGNYGAINLLPIGALPFGPNFNKDLQPDNFRRLQNYGVIQVIDHSLSSNYNALQTTLARQRGRINYTLAYTWSKAMGIRGSSQGQQGGNPFNLDANYGPLAYDRTHIFSASYIVQLGYFKQQHALVRGALGGWQVSGITQLASGVNLQATQNSNFNATAPDGTIPFSALAYLGTPDVTLQPRIICDPRANLGPRQFINGNCFAPPVPGQNGDYVFPYLRGPALINNDLALFKNFQISESRKLEFRASAYNFLNHPLWSFTGGDDLNLKFDASGKQTNSLFGYTSTKYGRRILNLSVKFYF